MTYYCIRWKGKADRDWHYSLSHNSRSSLEEMRKWLPNDIGYFYNDITIEVIKVTEEVIETHQGSQSRGKP